MEAKDLMTGCLYRVKEDVCLPKGTIVIIRGIDADNRFPERHLIGSATCLPVNSEDGFTYGVWIEYLEPIPLTPEILEKNDFLANKHVYPYPYYEYINEKDKVKIGFAFPQGNRTSYKEPWVYIDSECALIVHLPCKYAHHLQHVLKLCGIEKEIIL